MEDFITPVVLSVLLTLVAVLKAPYEARLARQRSLKNIDDQPFIDEGQKFKGIYCLGKEEPIFGSCIIEEINTIKAYVLFRSLKDNSRVVFTGAELQELVPITMPED